jgi:DNA ligase-1
LLTQAGSPVDARTCKHLRDLLGDAYEAARIKWKNPNGPPLKPASKKGKAKSKPASKGKRKRDDDDDDEDDKKPKSKSKRAKVDDDDDDDDEDDSGGKKVPALLLANKWDIETGPDPTGWWISEKLDGVR